MKTKSTTWDSSELPQRAWQPMQRRTRRHLVRDSPCAAFTTAIPFPGGREGQAPHSGFLAQIIPLIHCAGQIFQPRQASSCCRWGGIASPGCDPVPAKTQRAIGERPQSADVHSAPSAAAQARQVVHVLDAASVPEIAKEPRRAVIALAEVELASRVSRVQRIVLLMRVVHILEILPRRAIRNESREHLRTRPDLLSEPSSPCVQCATRRCESTSCPLCPPLPVHRPPGSVSPRNLFLLLRLLEWTEGELQVGGCTGMAKQRQRAACGCWCSERCHPYRWAFTCRGHFTNQASFCPPRDGFTISARSSVDAPAARRLRDLAPL